MSSISLFLHASNTPLETMLDALRKYGSPRLMYMKNGWYCKVEMHVASQGCSFDVASEFNMKTASEAVIQCAERIFETLKKYKELQ